MVNILGRARQLVGKITGNDALEAKGSVEAGHPLPADGHVRAHDDGPRETGTPEQAEHMGHQQY